MAKKKRDPLPGVRIDMRAPSAEDKASWRAAAKAEGRSLTNWLAYLANTECDMAGFPRKDRESTERS